MKANQYIPSQLLKDVVKCYWTLEDSDEETPQLNTIIADGTIKMIFHYGGLYRNYPTLKTPTLLPRCFVIGQLTEPYIVEPVSTTGTFTVRFHSYGFQPLTDIPIRELENQALSLDSLFGQEGKELESKILYAKDNLERIGIIEDFLIRRLRHKKELDLLVKSTIQTITATKGNFSINQYAEQIGYNRRAILRKFTQSVGLNPKQYARIIRLQATLKTLSSKQVDSLTRLAYENNYFDQAHFIKEFKSFTGHTPKQFHNEQLKMSLVYENK